ncbi:MAG: hypothetical protein NTY38_10100, partial [Acidobacteria bacterium]|nr:hypothetical protein [Acidobacteriota bacterium]
FLASISASARVHAGTNAPVPFTLENDVLEFATTVNGFYLLAPEGSTINLPSFTATRNTGPKQFEEAVLGKPRDF